MSVVIAKKTKNGFIMGADSMCTVSGQQRDEAIKIFRCKQNEDIIMGVVGCLRDANILMVSDEIFDNTAIRRDALDFENMVKSTIPNLIKLFKEQYRAGIDKEDGAMCLQSQIMIAYKDKCYVIGGDYSVSEVNDFSAIGAPELMAYGCYEMTKLCDVQIPEDKLVENIIKSTIKKTIYVDYPIRIFSTENRKLDKIIEK